MWREGEDLVLRDKTTLPLYRVLYNVVGSIILFFCVSKLCAQFTSIEEVMDDVKTALIYLCIGLVAAYGLYLSYFPDQSTIVIGEEGIKIGDKVSYPWDEVTHAYYGDEELTFAEELGRGVVRGLQHRKGKKKKAWFLHVLHKVGQDVLHDKYKLNSFSYDEKEIKKAVEYWSGRDIGDKADLQRDQYIDRLVVEGQLTQEAADEKRERLSTFIPYFSDVKSTISSGIIWSMVAAFALCPLLYLLFKTDDHSFPQLAIFFFGCVIGPFLLAIRIAGKRGDKILEKFRQDEKVKGLTKEEFDECAQLAHLSNGESTLSDKILGVSFNVLTVAWVLLLIYTILTKLGVL